MWLLRMHNLVTARIALEDKVGSNMNITVTELVDTLSRSMWPSRVMCPQCYHLPDFQQSIQHYQMKHMRRKRVSNNSNNSTSLAAVSTEMSFATLTELETFLRHAIERVFSYEAVLVFLAKAYKL